MDGHWQSSLYIDLPTFFLWKSVIYHSILDLPFDAEVDEKFLNGIQTVSIDYYQ